MNFGVSTSMDVAISTPSLHLSFKSTAAISCQAPRSRNAYSASLFFGSRRFGRRIISVKADQSSSRATDYDFIIEDVPHLTDFLPDLPSYPNPLKNSRAYAIVKFELFQGNFCKARRLHKKLWLQKIALEEFIFGEQVLVKRFISSQTRCVPV